MNAVEFLFKNYSFRFKIGVDLKRAAQSSVM